MSDTGQQWREKYNPVFKTNQNNSGYIPGAPEYAQPGWQNPNTTKPTKPSNNSGYIPGAPEYAQPGWQRTPEAQASYEAAQERANNANSGSGGGGGGGGGSSAARSSAPAVPYPYTVAVNSGISHGEVNEVLSKSLRSFNKKNGTSFWLTSNGHIRVNGTGSYMSIDQQKAFNATIPVHAVDYKYGKAIDKALAGDATDLKNLDRFFTGKERPAGGYSKDYLTKEKEARSLGITVAELDKRNSAKAPAPEVSTGIPIAPPVREPDTIEKEDEKEKAKVAKSKEDEKEKEEKAKVAAEKSEEKRKDEEAKAKAAAAKADADEKQQQALAVATANKQSAKEARLKKIMEMRKPYMGGAASVGGSSDALVVPPITPASQVPPPPLP